MEYITSDNIKQVIEPYKKLFDIIQIVDPNAKKIVVINDSIDNELMYQDINCYSFWNTGDACKDCIAVRAVKEDNTLVKIQNDMEKMYIFFATPVIIAGKTMVLELLKDITGNLVFEAIDMVNGHEIRNIIHDIHTLLLKDSLTNLYNRRYLNQMLPVEIERSNRKNHYLSIVMVDIDGFKNINDTCGHCVGDIVIKKFSDIMTKFIRSETDWIARYGGDEFLICLHNVDMKEAKKIVERLRKSIERMRIEIDEMTIKVTASFGLVTVRDFKLEPNELIKLADIKLYEAKKRGGNKVVS